MEEIVTQPELDRPLHAPPEGSQTRPPLASRAKIEPWNLRDAVCPQEEQVQRLSQLLEGFSRDLSLALGVHLRQKVEVVLGSVEQLSYGEFLAPMPDSAYSSAFHFRPVAAQGMLQLDLSLAFLVVDLLLGGQGLAEPPNRELTEVEERILEGIGQLTCRELSRLWQPAGFSLEFEPRALGTATLRRMPAQERALAFSLQITMLNAQGALRLAFPMALVNALLRKVSGKPVRLQMRTAISQQENVRQRLLDSPVELLLATPLIPLKLRNLLAMRPGYVLPLRRKIDEGAVLRLGDRDGWRANPVQSPAGMRAAHLLARLPQPE